MTTALLMCQLSVVPVVTEAGPSVWLPVPEKTWLIAAGNRRGNLGAFRVRRYEGAGVPSAREFTALVLFGEADRSPTSRPAVGCESGLCLSAPLRARRAPAPATLLAGAGVAEAGAAELPAPLGVGAAASVEAW